MEGDDFGCTLALRADALGVAADGPGDSEKGGCEGVRPGETPLSLRANVIGVAADGQGDSAKGGCEGVRPGEAPTNGGRGGRTDCDGVHGEQAEG